MVTSTSTDSTWLLRIVVTSSWIAVSVASDQTVWLLDDKRDTPSRIICTEFNSGSRKMYSGGSEGEALGTPLGGSDGISLGDTLGMTERVGLSVGTRVGLVEGRPLGLELGVCVGE